MRRLLLPLALVLLALAATTAGATTARDLATLARLETDLAKVIRLLQADPSSANIPLAEL